MPTNKSAGNSDVYKDAIVLYHSTHCKYCNHAIKMLINYHELIVMHNVDKDGYPDYMPALPELVKYDANGNREDALAGVKPASVYINFFKRHLL